MIESLTEEQTALLDVYAQKWIAIATNTEPLNKEAAIEAAKAAYKAINEEFPDDIYEADSPMMGSYMAVFLTELYEKVNGKDATMKYRNTELSEFGQKSLDRLTAQLPKKYQKVFKKLDFSKEPSVESLNKTLGDHAYGNHESWLSYHDYVHQVLNIDLSQLQGNIELAKHCGWWMPYQECCILEHRPAQIHLQEQRLHNEDGPAVLYRDNFSIWSIEGIQVDEQIVMRPETQTIEQIENEENADIKAIRIERFGWHNYLKEVSALLIDSRENIVEGTPEALYRSPDGTNRLVAGCPTGRIFTMGVPENIETCEDAQKWLSIRSFNVVGRT